MVHSVINRFNYSGPISRARFHVLRDFEGFVCLECVFIPLHF